MVKRSVYLAAAAALALCSASVAAQSNVDLYGRINLSVEGLHMGEIKSKQMQDNSSRFGFRGEEAINNDLKAFFLLENGFDASTGTATSGTSFSREAYVGLRSKTVGQLRMGRILSPVYSASADYVSMHNHDTGTSSDALFGFQVTGANNNNSVAYMTPDLYGATLEASYSFAEADKNPSGLNVAANYDWSGLHLGAGYAKREVRGLSGDEHMFVVRALYTLGDFTVGGYYERDELKAGSRNNFRLALAYTLGRSEFHLNGGYAGDVGDISDSYGKQMTVAYNYNLSKRTKLYAFYTRILNSQNAAYGVEHAGDDFSSIAVGLRHNF